MEEETTQFELVAVAVDYWKEVSEAIPLWGKVKMGDLKATDGQETRTQLVI